MTCCDPLEAECPLELTEDDCRTLITLLRHAIAPDQEPLLPQIEPLRVILEKLEFAVGPDGGHRGGVLGAGLIVEGREQDENIGSLRVATSVAKA
jgi:hypothetical protein